MTDDEEKTQGPRLERMRRLARSMNPDPGFALQESEAMRNFIDGGKGLRFLEAIAPFIEIHETPIKAKVARIKHDDGVYKAVEGIFDANGEDSFRFGILSLRNVSVSLKTNTNADGRDEKRPGEGSYVFIPDPTQLVKIFRIFEVDLPKSLTSYEGQERGGEDSPLHPEGNKIEKGVSDVSISK